MSWPCDDPGCGGIEAPGANLKPYRKPSDNAPLAIAQLLAAAAAMASYVGNKFGQDDINKLVGTLLADAQ